MLRTDTKKLSVITLLYIYIPVVVFLCGFTAWYVWLVTVLACGYSFYRIYKRYKGENIEGSHEGVTMSWSAIMISFVFIEIMCLVRGFWDVFEQSGDWSKHNAVLHDLVEHSWPVIYTEHEKTLLTYYLGQYMLPALLGKAFSNGDVILGFNLAHMIMSFWAYNSILPVDSSFISFSSVEKVRI